MAPQHPFRSREKKRKYFPIPFNGKPVSFARSFSVFFFSIRPPSGARLHLPNAPFRRLGASCMLMLFPFLPSNVNLPPSMSIHWKDPPPPLPRLLFPLRQTPLPTPVPPPPSVSSDRRRQRRRFFLSTAPSPNPMSVFLPRQSAACCRRVGGGETIRGGHRGVALIFCFTNTVV